MTEEESEWLDALPELEEGLKPNELQFIEDISHRRKRELSEKQHDWLESIHRHLIG
jgi:hypothetical protein